MLNSYFDSKAWVSKTGVNWEYDIKGDQSKASEFNHPVVHVSWLDAIEYCGWLSRKATKKYFLPSEAQWEYAARGGVLTERFLYSGSNQISNVAWHYDNSKYNTHAIGTRKANELEIFDMTGNVLEWCNDWYDSEYYKNDHKDQNPEGPIKGYERVVRGGSWLHGSRHCRVSLRLGNAFLNRSCNVGFRVASGPQYDR